MTKGRILSVRGGDIRFAQAPSVRLPRLELIYRRDAGVIDLVGYGAASSVFVNCVPAELRPVLSRYDAIWPPDGDWQDEQGWARSVLAMLDNAFIHPVLFVLIMLVVWIRWVPVVRRAIRTGRLRVRGLLARGPLGWRVFDRERDPKRYWGLLIPVLVVNGVIPMLIVLAMLLGIPPFKIWS